MRGEHVWLRRRAAPTHLLLMYFRFIAVLVRVSLSSSLTSSQSNRKLALCCAMSCGILAIASLISFALQVQIVQRGCVGLMGKELHPTRCKSLGSQDCAPLLLLLLLGLLALEVQVCAGGGLRQARHQVLKRPGPAMRALGQCR